MTNEVISACVQADERGLLQGDANLVRSVAKTLSRRWRLAFDAKVRDSRMDVVDGLTELYVQLNFPDVYERAEKEREARDEATLDDFAAGDMDEMLSKLRAAAGML